MIGNLIKIFTFATLLHLNVKIDNKMTNTIKSNSDMFGMWSSGLCLIHCLATPFLFVAKSCSMTCCAASPSWWGFMDFGFLAISFIAIYFTAKHSSKDWVKFALYGAWTVLTFIILNEYLILVNLSEYAIYAPAIALIGLHFYNRQYCQCDNGCCDEDLEMARG